MIALKFLALWFALLLGGFLGGMLLPFSLPGEGDGPFGPGQAFLLVNALYAAILTATAQQARWRGLALNAAIGVTYLFAQSLLLLVEAIWFNDFLQVPIPALLRASGHSAFQAALVGMATGLLWRSSKGKRPPPLALNPSRLPLAALLYVALYWLAGMFIALASPELREYYGVSTGFASNLSPIPLLALQFARGLVWGALALLLGTAMGGRRWRIGLTTGLAFAILASASLLYPTGFMPWSVRWVHLVEVMISNTLFGWLAIIILASGKRATRRTGAVSGAAS